MPSPDRRTVLASAAVALGPLAGLARGEKAAKHGRIKQSACAWCYTGGKKWSLDKLCEVAVELGIQSIELLQAKDFPTLKKHNLVCAMVSTGMGLSHGFNNPRHREELVTKTKAAIDAATEAKFPSVIGFVGNQWIKPTDPKSGDIPKDIALRECVAGIKEVIGHAEKAGVNLVIEHLNSRVDHPGFQGDDLDFNIEILKAVGSPRAKVLFDIYHVQIMHGDLVRRIEACKEYIGHIHTAGNPGRHELDDSQEIHYPPLMKKLLQIGYTGYVGQEFLCVRDQLAGLRQAVELCDVTV